MTYHDQLEFVRRSPTFCKRGVGGGGSPHGPTPPGDLMWHAGFKCSLIPIVTGPHIDNPICTNLPRGLDAKYKAPKDGLPNLTLTVSGATQAASPHRSSLGVPSQAPVKWLGKVLESSLRAIVKWSWTI